MLERYQPEQFSEHLAWSTHGPFFLNDLLPLRYDDATLTRVCAHIDQVQNTLQRTMLLENPATYIEFDQASYTEAALPGHLHGDEEGQPGSNAGEVLDGDGPIASALAELKTPGATKAAQSAKKPAPAAKR